MSSPPPTGCFESDFVQAIFDTGTISKVMVNCLNLTEIGRYVSAYCTNPPRDDDCPFDFCPNPEIAGMNLITYLFSLLSLKLPYSGPLVRIASKCRRTLVFQHPDFFLLRRLRHNFLCWYVAHRSCGSMLIDASCAYLLFTQESTRSLLVAGPHHILPVAHMSHLHHPRRPYTVPCLGRPRIGPFSHHNLFRRVFHTLVLVN